MIAIICAMRVELEQILARMEDVRQEEQAGVQVYLGVLEGHQAAAAVCGVGKVSAALCTQMLISRYAPSALLHSGIAGGVAPELRHMDLVVAAAGRAGGKAGLYRHRRPVFGEPGGKAAAAAGLQCPLRRYGERRRGPGLHREPGALRRPPLHLRPGRRRGPGRL